MVVAIDGPAGSGKSTIARMVAEKLGFYFLNTGSFYRAYTLSALDRGIDPLDRDRVLENAEKITLTVQNGSICIDGKDEEGRLHTPDVDRYCSQVSSDPRIRKLVNTSVRKIAEGLDIVTEGRDTTTVIFPDAECKFYFDASPEIRASRRVKDQPGTDYEDVLKAIMARDKMDIEKADGALKIAPGALVIDTSMLTINQVCEKVVNAIRSTQSYLQQHLMSIPELEVGQIVTGTVVQTNDESVLVDIGYKSEGKIPVDEFMELPKLGDKVAVTIVKLDDGRGQVVVSKKRAEAKERTEILRKAAEDRTPVLGKFAKVIKGGYEVDLGADYKGFCPLSKADIVRVEDPETLIGKTDYFVIDKFHAGTKLKSVVSRREYLEKKIKENKDAFFQTVQIGDVVQGEVKSFTSFGAFIDLGGFDGLLHINDMSWGHVTRPKDFVKKGQIVQLRLINIDPETQKINLSLKHMTPDPWTTFEERYQVGDVIKKPVTKITSFGVFIELEPGIEGLAHISELSWTKRVTNPKDIVSIGDVVEAKILGYDLDKKRVSLGLKQLQENPWDTINDRYPVGKVVSGPVVKVTNSGAFINLEDGIDGFLHIDDISWTKKIKSMDQFCKEGDMVEVVVSRVEPENRRVRLSVKQLEGNPWSTLKKDYPKYSTIQGTISSVTDFGVFVKVLGDIEGLISKYNLVGPDDEYKDEVLESYKAKVGEPITAMVVDINPQAQKLSLSIKEMIRRSQESEMAKYMADDKEEDDTYNPFADMLKAKSDEE